MTLGMVSAGLGLVLVLFGFIVRKSERKLFISSVGIGGIAVIFGLYAMVVNIL